MTPSIRLDETAVRDLHLIERAQVGGFTLSEIRGLLRGSLSGERVGDALPTALRAKLSALRQLRLELDEREQQLEAVLAEVEGKPDGVSCIDNVLHVLGTLEADRIPASVNR